MRHFSVRKFYFTRGREGVLSTLRRGPVGGGGVFLLLALERKEGVGVDNLLADRIKVGMAQGRDEQTIP